MQKIALYYLFYTHVISFIVGRPYMTVQNFIARTLMNNKARCGRPPKLLKRDRRSISRYIKRNRTAKVHQHCAPHVSPKTIDHLQSEKWLAKARLKLTAKRARKHLEWARGHQLWTAEDF